MVIKNKDKFGNEVSVDQMIKLWKRDVEKSDIMYEVKRHEVFLNNKDRKTLEQAHLRKVTKRKSR